MSKTGFKINHLFDCMGIFTILKTQFLKTLSEINCHNAKSTAIIFLRTTSTFYITSIYCLHFILHMEKGLKGAEL